MEKRKVPEVLWKLFQNRAQTLAETILSLIRPTTSAAAKCRCRGRRRCFRCWSDNDLMTFLLRENDPSDYRNLLNQCFVVFSDNAPPPPPFDPQSRWSQLEIVRRTIEMILMEQASTTNVICTNYDKHNRSSSILDTLTSATWSLLQKRVGDNLMIYLLKYSLIFMPLSRSKHHQVAGVAINDLCWKFLKRTSKSKKKQRSLGFPEFHSMFDKVDSQSSSGSCVGCDVRDTLTPCKRKRSTMSCHGDTTNATVVNCSGVTEEDTMQGVARIGKRVWPYDWQRKSKHRKLSSQNVDTSSCSSTKEKTACSCCSIVQTLRKVQMTQITRQSILYKMEQGSSILPRRHKINSLKPNASGANALFKDIFGLPEACIASQPTICSHSNDICTIGTKCIYHSLHKLLKKLVQKATHCPVRRLLSKHCTTPFSQQMANGGHSSSSENILPSNPQDLYCPKEQVVSFIWAACRSIVPREMLGSTSSWRNLRKNISMFIRLRRYEKFSLPQCMHKLKTSDFPFLSDKHSLCYLSNDGQSPSKAHNANIGRKFGEVSDATNLTKQKLLERWIYWFFTSLVVPLIQGNFYVTESEHGKLEVLFYQKLIWEELMKKSVAYLKEQSYSLLDDASVEKIVRTRKFGVSWVRLCPKANGIRPLANLRAPSRLSARQFKAVNVVLRDLHAVLKDMQLKRPEKLGSSVFSYNDVYKKLRHFLSSIRSESSILPCVFMVVADVKKAFDSVDQDKLLHVIRDVITDDHLLQISHQVIGTKRYMQICQHVNLSRQSSAYLHSRSSHSIIINQGLSKTVRKEDLYFNLKEHVKHNILQVDKKFYLQHVGIAQGSIASSLLCSFYYGHMETSKLFPFLEKTAKIGLAESLEKHIHGDASVASKRSESASHDLLLRFIDDFLFISTSKKQSLAFFTRVQRGFCEYNCHMNGEKFALSFNVDKMRSQSNRVYIGEDGSKFIRWSGLFINCKTLEVQADYTRYLHTHLRSTLTVRWQGDPKGHLKEKLCDYMRPKCHVIFYDSNINSAPVVRLNIHQAFLLSAMKFHCYIRVLSDVCTLGSKSLMKIILNSLRYMFKLIKKRRFTFDVDPNFRPTLNVKKGEVIWLGLTAYIQVLKQKQSRHKELLTLLELKLKALNVEMVSTPAMEYAVDKSNSSVLWKIKY